MTHHAAYGLPLEALDVVIVEDSKPMALLIRSVVASLQPARIRVFEKAEEAIAAMLVEPPNLIVTDCRMQPVSGFQLLRTIRDSRMAPLCFVPVIMVTAYGTRPLVSLAFAAGAHQVLVKPLSPALLIERIRCLRTDGRKFSEGPDGNYVIDGLTEALAAHEGRSRMLRQARAFVAAKEKAAAREEAKKAEAAPVPATHRPAFAAVTRETRRVGRSAGQRRLVSP